MQLSVSGAALADLSVGMEERMFMVREGNCNMAEVAGLVVGTVALATMFSTCVDLCDRFELGKTYTADYNMSCNKVKLLKLRLLQWGQSLDVDRPGHENPTLRAFWPEQEEVIAQGLLGMQKVIERALILENKYKLNGKRLQSHRSTTTKCSALTNIVSDRARAKLIRGWISFNKRVLWAFHGKEKFDGVIKDLAFLMDQLDSVKNTLARRPVSMANTSSSRSIPPPTNGERSKRYRAGNASEPVEDSTAAPSLNVQVPPNWMGDILTGKQTTKGHGLIGNIGNRTHGKGIIQVFAHVEQETGGSGVVGTISDRSAPVFFKAPSQDTDEDETICADSEVEGNE